PVGHGGALADLVGGVGQAVAPVQAEHVAHAVLIDHGGVEPFAVAGEVAADGVRHRAQRGLAALQDDGGRGGPGGDHDHLGVDAPLALGQPVVLAVHELVVHPVAAVPGPLDALYLVQRPDLGAVRDGGG